MYLYERKEPIMHHHIPQLVREIYSRGLRHKEGIMAALGQWLVLLHVVSAFAMIAG
jgi:hypothetical protein